MTAIEAIVANSAVPIQPDAATAAKGPKQKLDGEMFMQLLVTQLRSQDPSSPMDTNAMMTQTTQLASMEALTNLTNLTQETFSLQMRIAAAGLVGKEVGYVDEAGKPQKGIATAVSFVDAVPTVTIGDKSIRLDAISGVTTAS